MKNIFYFIVTSLIWGSTWLVITFQLGKVDPIVSVVYRFALASGLLFLFCKITNRNLKYSFKEHLFMFQLGLLLFGVNYWLSYSATMYITSGLVAVVFSTIVFFNIFNGFLFLKTKIRINVLLSALIGFSGLLLVFHNEVLNFDYNSSNTKGFVLAMSGALIASLGNITSARNQINKMPVIQSNAYGMLYGAIIMTFIALVSGITFNFDFSVSYILSLSYLSVFGSIVAFSAYLTLLGNIGADKAAYVTLVFPIIALILSTIFEGYQWSVSAIFGIFLVSLGNILVLRKK